MSVDVLIDLTPLDTPSRFRGIGRYVSSLAVAMAELKEAGELDVEIVGLRRLWGWSQSALDPSLRYSGDPRLHPNSRQYKRYLFKRRLAQDGLAYRAGAHLLHLTEPRGTPLSRRVPRIVTCHDLIQLALAEEYLGDFPGERLLQVFYDRRRYRSAERVIAISDATARDLTRLLDVDPERIDVVYHGVDHKRFCPEAGREERTLLRRELGLERPYVLFTGAGDTRKNLPRLVRAFARSGRAGEVELVFAGCLSEQHRRALEDAIEETGSGSSVHQLGHVDESLFPALYRQCLVFAFPSRYEGFGLPLLEAMACGAPTITTQAASLVEVAGKAAWFVESEDTAELAEALMVLIDSDSDRAELRRKGLERAAEFTWERCARQTLASYRRALSGCTSR